MNKKLTYPLFGFFLLICLGFGIAYGGKIWEADNQGPIGWESPNTIPAEYAVPWQDKAIDAADFASKAAETLDQPWKNLALDDLKSGKIEISIKSKSALMLRPEMFGLFGATPKTVAEAVKADQFIVLHEDDKPTWPPTREFVAREIAAAIARKLNTVVVDPMNDRAMSSEQAIEHMNDKTEREAFTNWTPILVTPMEDGEWMTSAGLSRLGMPEIEVTKVPPQMSREMVYAASGLAWVVAKKAKSAHDAGQSSVFLPRTVEVNAADISEAFGHEVKVQKTSFYLKLRQRDNDSDIQFLTLTPPPESKQTPGEYYFARLAELFGRPTDEVIKNHRTTEMEKAIATARVSLNKAREKFLADPLQKKGKILIKFQITDGTNNEYLWGYVTDWSSAEKLSLSCTSTADLSTVYQPGKIIQIKEDIIRDWAFQQNDGEITEGNWTTKVLKPENQ